MKILKRHIISTQEAEKLIEKYYEGETSVAEENLLRYFLTQKNVSKQFEAEKAIFGYFESEKQEKTIAFTPNFWKWTASAVAMVAVLLGVFLSTQPGQANYAYVDGKKTTNQQVVFTLAQSTVNSILSANTELESNFENIQSNQVIEGQLDAFAEIDFN